MLWRKLSNIDEWFVEFYPMIKTALNLDNWLWYDYWLIESSRRKGGMAPTIGSNIIASSVIRANIGTYYLTKNWANSWNAKPGYVSLLMTRTRYLNYFVWWQNASLSAIQNETRKYYEILVKTSNWALIDLLTPEEVTEWFDLHTKLKFDQSCAAYRYLKEKKFTAKWVNEWYICTKKTLKT